MHAQPQGANFFKHGRDRAADGAQLARHEVCLLRAHPLGGRPVQAQQEGRYARSGDELLEYLAHGYLAVEDLIICADDLDLHVAHGHEVAHRAVFSALHGRRPLGGYLLRTLLSRKLVDDVALGLVDHREAHVARSFPVDAQRLIYLHEYPAEEGHTAEHGHAVRRIGLGVKGGEQQQVLVRHRLNAASVVRAAKLKIKRGISLADLHVGNVAAEHRRYVAAAAGDDFAHRSAAGDHGVEVRIKEALQPPLSPARVHVADEVVELLFGFFVAASGFKAAGEPDDLHYRGVDHRHRLADGAVKPRLAAAQRDIAVEQTEGVLLPAP